MTMKKYVEAILASKEDREKTLAPARAKEQDAQLGLVIEQLKIEVMGHENSLVEMAGKYPLPIDEIIDAQDNLDLQKRRLAQLERLRAELFA